MLNIVLIDKYTKARMMRAFAMREKFIFVTGRPREELLHSETEPNRD